MPKFKGQNTKAVEARERKNQQAKLEKQKKEKEAEDKRWEDNDKHVLRKQQRKLEQEKKKQEALQRKKENDLLYKEEQKTLDATVKTKKPAPKVTRAQIEEAKERRQEEEKKLALEEELKKQRITIPEEEDEPVGNVNHIIADSIAKGELNASTVEEANSILNGVVGGAGTIDMHPEKRVKASYKLFEEYWLPIKKQENPSLKQSQLRQQLRKEWKKSPENPMNQR